MDIYVKALKKLDTSKRLIRLEDLADIVSDEASVGKIKLIEIDSKRNALFLITAADIVRAVRHTFPNASVISIGEQDTIVNFCADSRKPSAIAGFIRIAFVAAILLFGSATAVMSFFTDAEIAKVFENFYRLVFGTDNDRPLIFEIPFSIGIAIGIIVFFNHFAGLKLTRDPTPIEVEMAMYEQDIADTMIDSLADESEDGGNETNT